MFSFTTKEKQQPDSRILLVFAGTGS